MDQPLINRIVEAALLASSQPLTLVQLAGLFPLDEPAPEGSLQAALDTLQAESAGRGVELVEVASGWRYQVQADVHPWVARLWTERQTKYTRATLETLALIAYRQPITRGEIEQVRGVATNSNIIKALEEREWIRVVGHRDMPGRPELLGTTRAFLDYFGLKRLDELPPLSELKDFGELEPQFEFEGERAVGGIAAGVDSGHDGDAGAANDPSAGGADADDADASADAGTGSGEARRDADEHGAATDGADLPMGAQGDPAGTRTLDDAATDDGVDTGVDPEPDADADAGSAREGTGHAARQDDFAADLDADAPAADTGQADTATASPGVGIDADNEAPVDADAAADDDAVASDDMADAARADDDRSPRPTPPSRIADRDDAVAEPDALADDGDSTGVRHE